MPTPNFEGHLRRDSDAYWCHDIATTSNQPPPPNYYRISSPQPALNNKPFNL